MDKFENTFGIDSRVTILDRDLFDKLKSEYDDGVRQPDKDVIMFIGKNSDGTYGHLEKLNITQKYNLISNE